MYVIYSREVSDTGEFTWCFLSRDFRRKYWRDGQRKIPRVPEKPFIYAASSQFSPWQVLIITDTILSPMINLATFWIYVTHDSQLCIKSKKFTGIFNNKLNKRYFLLSNRVSDTGEFTWCFLSRDFRRKYWRDGRQRTASGICCFIASIMIICIF
jgi:hypothetical protein